MNPTVWIRSSTRRSAGRSETAGATASHAGSKPRAAISWSGGKDSCAALARARTTLDVTAMVTMVDEQGARSRSHGLRAEVLDAQADRLGLARVTARCSWASYDDAFSSALECIAGDGFTHVVFGDILFDEHRRWAERICAPHGLTAVEPLWGLSTTLLLEEWIASGAAAVIVTARAACLDQKWLGRKLDTDCLSEFARLGVDPCGERGEYHTVVTDAPLFERPLRLRACGQVQRSDCWALDVAMEDDARSA